MRARARAARLCRCAGVAAALAAAITPPSRASQPNDAPSSVPAASSDARDNEASQLEVAAEAAIRAGDWAAAEAALRAALDLPENAHTARAHELLGILRGRTGNPAEARRIYADYLLRYPAGPDAERVRQRLAAAEDPVAPDELRAVDVERERAWSTDTRGAFSQWYLHDRSRSDFFSADIDDAIATDRRINVDELLTTADVTFSATGPETRIELEAAAAYVDEYRPVVLVGSDRQQGSYSLLYDRSLEIENTSLGLSAKTGRQTRFGDGIFGRFDGTLLGWQLAPQTKLNVFGGHPVLSPRDVDADDSRTFRGASIEYASRSGAWWTSLHWLDQETDGLTDRSSVGAELRINGSRGSFYTSIDYDRFFDRLNAAYIGFNHNFDGGSSLSLSGQRTHFPLLALSNSIIGQPVPTIEAVRETFDEETLELLARDRTLESRNATLTYSKPLGSKLELIGDVTVARTTGSPASGGVPEYPESGAEQFVGLQLVGTGLIGSRDVWTFGVRSAALRDSNVRLLDVAAWLRVTERFSMVPRLQLVDVDRRLGDEGSQRLSPSIRFVYSFSRRAQLDASISSNTIEQRYGPLTLLGQRREEDGTAAYVGYRILF